MLVQRVAMPASGAESWTVLGADDVPVEPVERYLAYLTGIERSPNTVKAYARDLKDYWVFLAHRDLDWREVRLEDVGEFVAWLRLPPAARSGQVAVLPAVEPQAGASTINRKLSAVGAFYLYQARNGVDVGELLTTWQLPGRRGGWKPFLNHVSKGRPQPRRVVPLRAPAKLPRVLTTAEVQAILDACDRLRDRFLFALLYDSGVRVGEALGLRHEDIAAAECEVTVVPRTNANGARSKSREARTIPVSTGLIRLYADYLHGEYGQIDSDYVFVNLWREPAGQALSYPAVCDLVLRLRRRTGIDFDPHWCRHTMATRLLRDQVPVEVVSKVLGHASITTTLSVYGHLTSDVLSFPADDPVFGGPPCKIPGCQRPARNRDLCWGHHTRWYDQGQPDLKEFAATTSPRWRRQTPSPCCRADGCGYGAHARWLCKRHLYEWQRAGRPDLDGWQPATVMRPEPPQPCQVSWCDLWAEAGAPLCARHNRHWRRAGRPDPADYAEGLDTDRVQRHDQIDVSPLNLHLKLEIQYALQCRRDDGTAKVFPHVASQLARLLAATTVTSLLNQPEDTWARQFPRGRPRSLLLYAYRHIDDLAAGSGWDTEYSRDVWRLRKLGFGGNPVLRFDRMPQPWLRELARRWVRWRLTTGQTLGTARAGLHILTRFAVFLATHSPPIGSLAHVDRAVLESYLADLHTEWAGRNSHHAHIEQLGLFLHAIHRGLLP